MALSVATADSVSGHGAGVLTVDLSAVVANWRQVRGRLAPGCLASAVVKADAYGLGALRVGSALYEAGCRFFYVAHLDEALALAEALPPGATIAVLHGLVAGEEKTYAAKKLIPVLNTRDEIGRWVRHGAGCPALVHVDTGMNRLGLSGGDIDWFLDDGGKGFELAGVMSHLACADETGHPMNDEQRVRFEKIRTGFPGIPGGLANSSGIFLGPSWHFDQVRPGSCLYGINPTPLADNPMRSVVRLSSTVLQVREAGKGESVGYGASFRLPGAARLATVALGYADGFLRSNTGRAQLFVAGRSVPVLGRVSMDLVVLDVSGLPEGAVRPGTEVEVLGPNRTVDAAGQQAGTIGYEILTGLGRRLVRHYIG